MRRVVVTGVGLMTALGSGREQVWAALLAGQSGIGPITAFDPSSLSCRLAAEIHDFRAERFATRRALRATTRNDQLALAGGVLAVEDAGLDPAATYDPERCAVFVGGNKEISNPEHLLEGSLAGRRPDGRADIRQLGLRAAQAFYPLYYVEGLQSASLFHLSQRYGLKGPNAYFHGTADAGATAIGRAFRAVRRGEADLALAGGFDDATSWWVLSKMDGLGVLSTDNEAGATAFRPYDRRRTGSVLGEGAAFLVLEEYAAARRRDAHVYAEVNGFAGTFDGDQLLTPDPAGRSLAVAVRRSLDEARVDPGDVGYVATHGCATPLGDASEAAALSRAFPGEHRPVASSVKPAAGHLVAGAGALNAAVCALAIDSGDVPPTLNLDSPDPACPLDWVPHEARTVRPRHAVALARGLAGQQVALALSVARPG